MKRFLPFCSLLLLLLGTALSQNVSAQTTITLGSDTATSSSSPIHTYYNYNYSQQIYTTAEVMTGGLTGSGTITSISFNMNANPGSPEKWKDWKVYLGNTDKNNFSTTSDWVPLGSLTEVFNGDILPGTSAGWKTITLTTPFHYTGGNLVVAVHEYAPGYIDGGSWKSYNTARKRAISYYSDGTNPNPATPPAANVGPTNVIPQLRFVVTPLPVCMPATSGGSSFYVTGFSTSHGGSNINKTSAGSTDGYEDFHLTDVASAMAGATVAYNFTVNGSAPYGHAIWIDLNGDGVFQNSELVASGVNTPPYSPVNTFTIPANTPAGAKRMRILATESPAVPADPCHDAGAGEYEDYTFIVLAPACAPNTTSGSSHYITNFKTSGGVMNIDHSSGNSAAGYQDFHLTEAASALPGTTIRTTMTIAGNSNYGRAIWIDFNNDGVFQVDEQVLGSSSYANSPAIDSFQVPLNVTPGAKRMRILASYTPNNPNNPCNNSDMGEYEDYTFTVLKHCQPATISGATHYISHFTTTGGVANIDQSSGGSAGGYQDFHAADSVVIMAGGKIHYHITATGGGSYGHAIWIDLNGDGVFQSSEQIVAAAPGAALADSFVLPLNLPKGHMRMRVLLSAASGAPADPCLNGAEGEYEDYTLTILEHCMPKTSGGSTHYIARFSTFGGATNIDHSSSGSTNGYQSFHATDTATALAGATLGFRMQVAVLMAGPFGLTLMKMACLNLRSRCI